VPLFFRVAISKRRVPKRRPPQTGCSPRCTLSHHVCTRVRFSRRQDASRCTPLGNRPVITGDARPEGPGQKDTISFHRRPATHPAQAHRHEQDPRRVGSPTIRTNKEHVKKNLHSPVESFHPSPLRRTLVRVAVWTTSLLDPPTLTWLTFQRGGQLEVACK
jgi:hypothetical protein